jgi:hypothetical protein
MKRKVLTVDQIYKDYGYKPNTLKYMRTNPDANGGDVPNWFPVGNRPHYPEDQFDAWHNKQIQKAIQKNKKVKSVKSVKLVKSS